MPNYSEAKIYKLVCNKTGLVYYGSTCQPLYKRKFDHKIAYLSFLQGSNRHLKAFEIIKNDDYDIVLVEDIKCENKYQLEQRERYFIENNKCVNKVIPTRTKKEYNEANKEKIKEYLKEYKQKNKEKIKNQKKEYIEKNKDKINEKRRANYQLNKEKINKIKNDLKK
jgi:hypothetical protein